MRYQSREKLNDLWENWGKRDVSDNHLAGWPFPPSEGKKSALHQVGAGLIGKTWKRPRDQFDFIDMEIPVSLDIWWMLEDAQLVVALGCLRYSSLQTLSAKIP